MNEAGMVRSGWSWSVGAWCGMAGGAWRVKVRRGAATHGRAGVARLGYARRGWAGVARQVWLGEAVLGKAWLGRLGAVGQVRVRCGSARSGQAGAAT